MHFPSLQRLMEANIHILKVVLSKLPYILLFASPNKCNAIIVNQRYAETSAGLSIFLFKVAEM